MCAHFAFNTFSVTVSYFSSANASALQEASQQTSTDSSGGVTLLGLALLLVLGMLFLGLVLLIIEYLEKSRIKRETGEQIASNCENVSQDEKKERLITLPLVLGMIVCFVYMVFVAVAA